MVNSRIIEIPLRNQNYDISQEFIDNIFKNLELYHIIDVSFLDIFENDNEAIKLIMSVIDDFLDTISKNEKNLLEFKNIDLIQKYSDYFILRNIQLLFKYLDDYSHRFNYNDAFFWSILAKHTSNFSLVNSFYYYFIAMNYIEEIFNISKTKEEYANNIFKIIEELDKLVGNEKEIEKIDSIVSSYIEKLL